jgi:hypothetical protein
MRDVIVGNTGKKIEKLCRESPISGIFCSDKIVKLFTPIRN